MRYLILSAALLFAACGSDENNAASNNTEANNETPSDGWWFEIDAFDIGRIEGNVVVKIANQIEGKGSGGDGEFQLLTYGMMMTEPGTYDGASLSGFTDSTDPIHRCAVDGTSIVIEVASVDPFDATFSGPVECWEGDELMPDDPDNPGETLPGTMGTVTGAVYSD